MRDFSRKITWAGCLVLLASCSSNNGLRKFDDGDLDKVMPSDLAKKFEVKDVGSASPTPSPTPAPSTAKKKVSIKKKKVSKTEVAMAEANSGPAVPPMR